jgi:hypothetical protein
VEATWPLSLACCYSRFKKLYIVLELGNAHQCKNKQWAFVSVFLKVITIIINNILIKVNKLMILNTFFQSKYPPCTSVRCL